MHSSSTSSSGSPVPAGLLVSSSPTWWSGSRCHTPHWAPIHTCMLHGRYHKCIKLGSTMCRSRVTPFHEGSRCL
jgi:hypothetical protein